MLEATLNQHLHNDTTSPLLVVGDPGSGTLYLLYSFLNLNKVKRQCCRTRRKNKSKPDLTSFVVSWVSSIKRFGKKHIPTYSSDSQKHLLYPEYLEKDVWTQKGNPRRSPRVVTQAH